MIVLATAIRNELTVSNLAPQATVTIQFGCIFILLSEKKDIPI